MYGSVTFPRGSGRNRAAEAILITWRTKPTRSLPETVPATFS